MGDNRHKSRFDANYEFGKSSEEKYKKQLEIIFNCSLNHDGNQFAKFDFYNDKIMVELKDRSNSLDYNEDTEIVKYNNRKVIDTLWFDKPKLDYAKEHWQERDYYVVWKLKKYFIIWKVDLNPIEDNTVNWYIEYDCEKDHGKGYLQSRNIVNVYTDAAEEIHYFKNI